MCVVRVCVYCVCVVIYILYLISYDCVVMANQDRYMCVQPGEAETGIRHDCDKVTFSLMHVMLYINPCESMYAEE